MIQPGNWRGARDSLGTVEVHVIQPGKWRGHVMQVSN